MRLTHRRLVVLAVISMLSACSTAVDATNPYDPSSPVDQQAKGKVKGSVSLERTTDPKGALVSLEGTSLTAVTDSTGVFQLTGAQAGTYSLMVTKDGYRQQKLGGVTVTMGETTDVGEIYVTVARGIVGGSVALTGLSDSGGATVTLSEAGGDTTGVPELKSVPLPTVDAGTDNLSTFATVTGSDGRWELTDVPAGQYFVVVSKEGFQTLCAGLVTIIKDGERKSVGRLELVSSSAVARFADKAGVLLPAYEVEGEAKYYTNSRDLQVQFTASGAVRMKTGWSAGEVAAAAWEGFAVEKSVTVPAGDDGDKTLYIELKDQCGLTRDYTSVVTVDTAAPEKGTVETDAVDGADGKKYIASTSGQVTVRLYAEDALSGVEGYRLTVDTAPVAEPYNALPSSGSVVVGVTPVDGLHTIYVEYRDRAGNETAAVTAEVNIDTKGPVGTVTVAGGAEVHGVYVDLTLAATDEGSGVKEMMVSNDAAFTGGKWEGYVTARRWELLAGDDGDRTVYAKYRDVLANESVAASAKVALVTKGGLAGKVYVSGKTDFSGTTVGVVGSATTMVTGAAGDYSFTKLPEGSYTLEFTHAGYHKMQVGPLQVVAGKDTTVSDVTMTVSKGSMGGKAMLAGETDHGGIQVSLNTPGYTTQTGSDGSYTFLDVPVAAYRVTAVKANWATAQTAVDVQVVEGSTVTAPDLTLAANPGSVSGVVKYEGGAAGSGVTVSVEGGGATTVTDGQGAYTLSGVEAGVATLLYTGGTGYEQGRTAGLVVKAGQNTVAPDVILSKARGTISGTVVLVGNSDASGVTVTAEGSGVAVVTGTTGAFKLDRVPVGTYSVTAVKEGYLRATKGGVAVTANHDSGVGTLTLAKMVGDFRVNNGDEFTKDLGVTLDLSNLKNPVTVRASEDATFNNGSQQYAAWQAAYPFTLSAGDGTKVVYLQYTDTSGQVQGETAPYAASIKLDQTAPVVDKVVINAGSVVTDDKVVSLQIEGSDNLSGVAAMQVRNDTSFSDSDPWDTYLTDVNTWTLADPVTNVELDKEVWVRFKDNAGNIGFGTKGTIRLDTLAPTGSFVINGGAGWATSAQVTLTVTTAATDVVAMAVSNTMGGTTVFSGYQAVSTWLLPTGDSSTPKAVYLVLKDAAGNTSLETSASIKLDETAPPVPTLSAGTMLTKNRQPALLWGAVVDNVSTTVSYEVELSASTDYSSPISCPVTGTSCTPGSALQDGTYYFHVRAKDAAGNASSYSAAEVVTVDGTAPLAPANLSGPASLTNNLRPSFSWDAVSDAVAYRVQLSQDAGFATVQRDFIVATAAAKLSTSLTDNTTWYWRVLATDAALNDSVWANGTSFMTDAMPPNAPSLVSPADTVTLTTAGVTLNWTASAGAAWYRVQVASDAGFNAVVFDTVIVGTSQVLTGADGTYWWHVQAQDAAGNQSAYAGPRSFTKDTTAPRAPIGQSPQNQVRIANKRPLLAWSDESASGAATYTLVVKDGGGTAVVSQTGAATSDLADGTYTWTVKAVDANANTSGTAATYTFTVDTTGPNPPAVTKTSPGTDIDPDNNATLKTPPLVFVWKAVTVAAPDTGVTYHLEVLDDGGTTLIDEWGLPQPSSGPSVSYTTTSAGVASGTYCWRVQVLDDLGNKGPWSAIYDGGANKCTGPAAPAAYFHIDNTPPDTPSPAMPISNSYVTTATPKRVVPRATICLSTT